MADFDNDIEDDDIITLQLPTGEVGKYVQDAAIVCHHRLYAILTPVGDERNLERVVICEISKTDESYTMNQVTDAQTRKDVLNKYREFTGLPGYYN